MEPSLLSSSKIHIGEPKLKGSMVTVKMVGKSVIRITIDSLLLTSFAVSKWNTMQKGELAHRMN